MSDEEQTAPIDDTPPCHESDDNEGNDDASQPSRRDDAAPSANNDASKPPGPEMVSDDDEYDARASAPVPPLTKIWTSKTDHHLAAEIDDALDDDKSFYSRGRFRGASADSLERSRDGGMPPRQDDGGSLRVRGASPPRPEEDASARDGREGARMVVVRMPPLARQASLPPHVVPTAFLVQERASSTMIYDAVPVPREPRWKKNRVLLVVLALVSFAVVAPGAALLYGMERAAPSATSPSSAPSACRPLVFREALLREGDACEDYCGVRIAAGNDHAVATVGSEVRFFRRTSSGWERRPESFRLPVDGLRPSISDSGSVVAVGAHRENNEAGSVHVFERGGDDDKDKDDKDSGWRQSAPLVPTTDVLSDDDRFGWSVDIDDDRILVGAKGRSGGAAYLFRRREDGSWSQQAGIYPNYSDPKEFGSTVALAGNTLAVADVFLATVFVYAYDESSDAWDVNQVISLSDCDDHFGESIAMHEEGLAIGCDWDDYSAGAVYYYELSPSSFLFGEYVLKQKLIASDRAQSNAFGSSNSLRMQGNIMTIGSFSAPNGSDSGSAYIFARRGPRHSWTQVANISSPDERRGNKFGEWITLAGRQVLVGSMTNAYSYELTDCQAL